MPDKIRTAVFGGTFNPIHNGHVAIVRSILEQNLADEVWLMVTPCNPWKEGQNLLDNNIRLELVKRLSAALKVRWHRTMNSVCLFRHIPQTRFVTCAGHTRDASSFSP